MKSNEEIFNEIKKQLLSIEYVNPDLIPNIDLYMDQVTTFMDKHLFSPDKSEDEHIITKTMINNYAKSELIPPPVKKKYSKDHMLMLILIHYLKNFLSIGDINSLFKPIKENFINNSNEINLEYIYQEIFNEYNKQLPDFMQALDKKYNASKSSFIGLPDEQAQTLQLFSLVCSISLDIYIQKYVVESLIEQINSQYTSKDNNNKTSKKEKKE